MGQTEILLGVVGPGDGDAASVPCMCIYILGYPVYLFGGIPAMIPDSNRHATDLSEIEVCRDTKGQGG